MDAAKKFWSLPELGERLVSFLDPLSALHLAQSKVMEKETLKKSFTSKAWGKLIGRSSLQVLSRPLELDMEKRKDLKVLVKILQRVELGELSPYLRPLLDLICESSPGIDCSVCVRMICPCRPDPHFISPEGFLLLEQVEAAFGTAEQRLESVGSFGLYHCHMLSAVSSRMSRQKETVTNISPCAVHIEDKSNLEDFVTLLKAEFVSVQYLYLRRGEFVEEGWQALAGALTQALTQRANWQLAKDRPEVEGDSIYSPLLAEVFISRKFLTEVVRESIKDIWDATKYGFHVTDTDTDSQRVEKSKYDREEAWTRLKQIADMTDDQFAADCKLFWGEDSDEEEESEGEEEESGEEDHDGEHEGDDEEDHVGEHEGDDEDS